MEIAHMLVLATGHLTKETALLLPQNAGEFAEAFYTHPPWWPSFARAEGWIFYTGFDWAAYEDAPEDLQALVRFAKEQKCPWLMLDRDAEILAELPHYDW